MDIRLITYFLAVVDEGNFSKAAKKLHISQPSLSKAIQDLENMLGLQLLHRTTRSVEVTEEGRFFYDEGVRLVTYFRHVEREMKRLKERGLPQLRVGMMESVKHWLMEVIQQFRQIDEETLIRLREVLSVEDVRRVLETFEADIVITNHVLMDEAIASIKLYDEPMALLIHKSHRLAKKEQWSVSDYLTTDWIMFPEGFQTRKNTQAYFHNHNVFPPVAYEVERFETAVSLVEKNLGVTFLPESYVTRLPENLPVKMLQINDNALRRSVYLNYLTSRHLSPSMKKFIELIQTRYIF